MGDFEALDLSPCDRGKNVAELCGAPAGMVRITQGLRDSGKIDTNSHTVKPEDAILWSRAKRNCFEVISLTEQGGHGAFSRIYIDIDCKMEKIEGGDEGFRALDERVRLACREFGETFGADNYSLTTGSTVGIKVSYHIVLTKIAMSLRDMLAWVTNNELVKILGAQIAPADVDLTVYKRGQKLRMLYSSKDWMHPRPLVLVHGEEVDTLATYLPEDVQYMRYTGATGATGSIDRKGASTHSKAKRPRVDAATGPTGPAGPAGPAALPADTTGAQNEIAALLQYSGTVTIGAYQDGVKILFPDRHECVKTGVRHTEKGSKFVLFATPTTCTAYCASSKCAKKADTFAHSAAISEILHRHGIVVRTAPIAAAVAAVAAAADAEMDDGNSSDAGGPAGGEGPATAATAAPEPPLPATAKLLLQLLRFVSNEQFARCAKACFTSAASLQAIIQIAVERQLDVDDVIAGINKSGANIGTLIMFAKASNEAEEKELARLKSAFRLESRRDDMMEGLQMLSGPTETLCEQYIPQTLHQSVVVGGGAAAAATAAGHSAPTTGHTAALKSAMGSGKSSNFFMPLIKNAFEQSAAARVLVIAPRISYSNEAVGSLERQELQVIAYNETSGDDKRLARNGHVTVIQAQSLHRLNKIQSFKTGRNTTKYETAMMAGFDLVVLDESESILSAMSDASTLGKHLIDNWDILTELMARSKSVVAADAFLSNRTVNYLQAVRPPAAPPRVIENTFVPSRGKAVSAAFIEDILRQILADAKAGKRLYCVITSLTDLKRIRDELVKEGIECLVHSAEGRNEKALKNVNESWAAVQVVLVTMTVTVGVNYDPPNKANDFDRMYVSAGNKCCTARDVAQAMARPRRLKDGLLYYLIKESAFGNARAQTQAEVMADVLKCEALHSSMSDLWAVTPPGVREVDVFNRYERRVNATIFDDLMKDFISRSGFELANESVPAVIPKREEKVAAVRIPYDAVASITTEQYKELTRTKTTDRAILASIQRYRFDRAMAAAADASLMKVAWEQATDDNTELTELFYQMKAEIAGMEEMKWRAAESSLAHHENKTLDRMRIVKKLLELLGLKNSFDEATVDQATVAALVPKVAELEADIRACFTIDPKTKTEGLPWARSLVKTALREWSGVKITTKQVGKKHKTFSWNVSNKNPQLIKVLRG